MTTTRRSAALLISAIAGLASPLNAQTLRYAAEKGQSFSYDFEIEVETPALLSKYVGTTNYRVGNVEDEQFKLTYQGGLLETVKRKDSSSLFPAVSLPRIPVGGPFADTKFKGRMQTTNQITLDRRGNLIEMDGDSQLPFLLGNLSLIPFEPLPMDEQESWTVDLGVSVNSTKESSRWRFGLHVPFGPFSERDSKTVQPASEVASYKMTKKEDHLMTFSKSYKLVTSAAPGVEAFEVQGDGQWRFNSQDRMPDSTEMRIKLQHKEDNVSITYPISVRYKRVSPEVVAARAAEAARKNAEAKAYAASPISETEKQELLKTMAGPDPVAIKSCLDRLASKTGASPDPELAKTVEGLLKHPSQIVVFAAERALPVWSPAFHKTYAVNKLYRGPLHVASTGRSVDQSTSLYEGQIVQALEFGNAWLPAKIQKLQPDGQIEVGVLMDGRVIRSLKLSRRNIQLAPDEVEQPNRPETVAGSKPMREWTDSTGKFKIRAAFVKQVDGLLYLKTEEGKELKISISRLCDADKALANEMSDNAENPFMP